MFRHRLLVRQIRKYLGAEPALAPEWQRLLAAVQEAYDQFDNDRRLTERAMDLSSNELVAANERLLAQHQRDLAVLEKLRASICALRGVASGSDAYPCEDDVLALSATLDELIRQRQNAEEALHQAQTQLAHVTRVNTLGELAASIAHEVNQPLTAIVNNADACLSLLQAGTHDLDEVREALSEIVNDANRASAVIARVRGLAKKTPVGNAPLQLRDLVADVMVLARQESAMRRVTVHSQISEDLPFVSGDRVQLQQVLLNLVVNGEDAMSTVEEEQRLLIIRGRHDIHDGRPAVTISVEDFGIGLKAEEMDRLFEPFYTTKPHGMGVGLAISRSIIEAHGGRLWAESNAGSGATFLFSLPAAGGPHDD